MSRLVLDLETDGLKPSEIFLCGILDLDSDEFFSYYGDNLVEGLVRASEADLIIGHSILGFDIPVIEKLTGGLVTFDRSKVIDTVNLGRKVLPEMENHKLATYGEMLGYPKLDPPPFDKFSMELIPYCERDCRLTGRAFDFMYRVILMEEETR